MTILLIAGAGALCLQLNGNIKTFDASGESKDRPPANTAGENVLPLGSDTRAAGNSAVTGTVGSVGMAGLTLGGGYGLLGGRFGLAADNLLGADVVLADGRLITVDAKNEPPTGSSPPRPCLWCRNSRRASDQALCDGLRPWQARTAWRCACST